MDILPHKLLFRGALHCASVSYSAPADDPGLQESILDLNERLLDHNDLETFRSCLGDFLPREPRGARCAGSLNSFWMTEDGVLLVTCPVGEYMMRVWRAAAKLSAGFADVTDTHVSRHVKYFSELTADAPSVNARPSRSPDGGPGPRSAVDALLARAGEALLGAYQGSYSEDDAARSFAACALAQGALDDMLSRVEGFMGMDEPLVWSGCPCARAEPAPESYAQHAMGAMYLLSTAEDLEMLLLPRYAETVLSLEGADDAESARELPARPSATEPRTISEEVKKFYFTKFSRGCQHTPRAVLLSLRPRHIARDLTTVYHLERGARFSAFHLRLLAGLYAVLGNGDVDRDPF